MTPLNSQQQQLLFDYSLGLTSAEENAEAEGLLASNAEALLIHQAFKAALEPLDSLEHQVCPADLEERTLNRLCQAAQLASEQDRLEAVPAGEATDSKTIKIPFWRNWGDIAAAAAAIILFVGVLLPTLNFARERYFQTRCQAQLAGIYQGLAEYAADNEGRLPTVAVEPGSPWWKVGYQGDENHSNSRRAWQLVRQGYVPLERFVCPGRSESRGLPFEAVKIQKYNDFPDRAYIQFSTRLAGPQSPERYLTEDTVLFADLNPIAERFPASYTEPLRLRLNRELLSANSTSHGRRGQNVLLYGGSVRFVRERFIDGSEDDFYTLDEMSDGTQVTGREVPSCETDAFLIP